MKEGLECSFKVGIELGKLEKLMEEIAGAPREQMHIRQPGEPCTYAEEKGFIDKTK